MDKNILLQFRNKLFQGGVAYTHVKRSLRELKDHADDIQQQALRDGYSIDKSKQLSMQQLGNLDSLAEDIISRLELKSFGYRYPKFSMLFGPLLMYLFTVVLIGLALMAIVMLNKWMLDEENLPTYSYWLNRSFDVARFALMYVVPPLMSVLFGIYALKNRLSKVYFICGIVILCVISCAISFQVIWPDPVAGTQGGLGIQIGNYIFKGADRTFVYGNSLRLVLVSAFTVSVMFLFHKKLEKEII